MKITCNKQEFENLVVYCYKRRNDPEYSCKECPMFFACSCGDNPDDEEDMTFISDICEIEVN